MEKISGVLIMTLLKNVISFHVDNSSSPHTDNWKNKFLVLGKGPKFGIDDTHEAQKNI